MNRQAPKPQSRPNGPSPLWLWGLTAVVGLYLIAILLDATPYLRGPGEWRWENADRIFDWRILPLLFLLIGVAAGALWIGRRRLRFRSPLAEGGFVVLLIALSLGEQVAALTLEPGGPLAPVFLRTVSVTSSGYYTAALNVGQETADLIDLLQTYPSRMPGFASDHLRTHPPGLVAGHWLIIQGLRQVPTLTRPLETWARLHQCPTIVGEGRTGRELAGALVAGGLIVLLGALAVVPVYLLGRRIGGQGWGQRAAILYLLVPAATVFASAPDQIYPLLSASSLLVFHLALELKRPAYTFLAGLLISIGSFLSFGCGAITLFLALYAILWPGRPPLRAVGRWLSLAAWFAGGLASVWLLYYLFSGVSVLEVLAVARVQHYALTASQRSYFTWLVFNLYDFFAFLGWPLAFLLGRRLADRRRTAAWAVAWAFSLTIILLDLSGTTRAEVARLWLFLMPLAVLGATGALFRDSEGEPSGVGNARPWWAIVFLQAALVLVVAFSWGVIDYVPHPVPKVTRRFEPLPMTHTLSATFGNQIELLGYDLAPSTVRPGEALELTLHWRALEEPQKSYKVFVHLLGPDGALQAQADNVPVDWALPTTCWVRGEVIADSYTLTPPPHAPPGEYTLAVGFYHEPTGDRLLTSEGDSVQLGPVLVSP